MKIVKRFLLIFLFFVCGLILSLFNFLNVFGNQNLTVLAQESKGQLSFYSYDTHPNFWTAGSDKWTAKKYSLHSGTPNPGYEFNWVWSGPYGSDQRYVIYQAYPNNTPGNYLEWERWSVDVGIRQATVHTYGGPSEALSKPRYSSYSNCLAKQTGIDWPNLKIGETFSYSPESNDYLGYCTKHWQSVENPGGYVAIYLKDSYSPGTSGRNNMCNSLVPASESPSANSICKISPKAAVIEQRYLMPQTGSFMHGCEMTVYAWGYPYDSVDNYKNWFRNGELRWSDWINLGFLSSPKSPDDHAWWGSNCARAWNEKPNWIYTGIYKLTATEYFDDGRGTTTTTIPTTTTSTTTTIPTAKKGDLNNDGKVDIIDLGILLSSWGRVDRPPADINQDGRVDIIDLGILLSNWGKLTTTTTLPPPPRDIFSRKDLIYGTEIGTWGWGDAYDGHPLTSNQACRQLARDAKISVVRWSPLEPFDDIGSVGGVSCSALKNGCLMPRVQFDNVINGIVDIGALPLIKTAPGWRQCEADGFTTAAYAGWFKEIVKQAGSRVQLYEFSNEANYYCGWSAEKYAQSWIQIIPQVKQYARSLGLEIYVGGSSWSNPNFNALKTFMETVKAEYDRTGNSDLLPSFISFHTYPAWSTASFTQQDVLNKIPEYGNFIRNVRSESLRIFGRELPVADSEYNYASDLGGGSRWDYDVSFMDKFTRGMLKMFRDSGAWMGIQFTFASNGGGGIIDMVEANCTPKPQYNTFKEVSISDSMR